MSLFARLVRRPLALTACAVTALMAAPLPALAAPAASPLVAADASDPYGAAVLADTPSFYWRLDETAGPSAADAVSGDPDSGTYGAGVELGAEPAPANPTGASIRLPGTGPASVARSAAVDDPKIFSLEVWFRTSTTEGGRLIGFGSSETGTSANRDRMLYLLDSGRLRYGVYNNGRHWIDSPLAYNDGEWHHVVVTQGSVWQRMYVDGAQVVSAPMWTPQDYAGYWRLGSDAVWADASSTDLAGQLDEAAVYPRVLGAAAVANHHRIGVDTPPPPPPNEAPTAAAEGACDFLECTFDAGASTDPDGSVAAYAWDFGDGDTATGATARHTFATGGEKTVTLTVTDDDGATDRTTTTVTALDPVVAADDFSRSVATGLGGADRGGAYTVLGVGGSASVSDGSAALQAGSNGAVAGTLAGVANRDTDLTATAWLPAAPSGSGVYLGTTVRSTLLGAYRARLRLTATGSTLQFVRAVGVIDTLVGPSTTVRGLTYTAGTRLRLRTQAFGTSPTTLRAKVWVDGTPEPAAWTLTTSDSLIGYQTAGGVGIWAYAASNVSSAVVRFDDLRARILPADEQG